MATKDILRAYEGSMAGPSMDQFRNIFQSEARIKGGKYDKGRSLLNIAVQGGGWLDNKIGDWQAAKKSGTGNVGDISGLKGFAKYALGSGEGGEYEDWADAGRESRGYDPSSEKDFTQIVGGKMQGAYDQSKVRAGERRLDKWKTGQRDKFAAEDDAASKEKLGRLKSDDEAYNRDMMSSMGGDFMGGIPEKGYQRGILGQLGDKIGGGIKKAGQFGRDVGQEFGTFFQKDKQGMGLGDYEDPTMGYRQGGYVKRYEEGGPVPYEPSKEDLLRMASMQATNREEGMYGMDQEGLMGKFHKRYETPSGQYGKMTDEEGNLWWKNEKDEEFSVAPEMNIKELPHLERARENAERQKWMLAELSRNMKLSEDRPKYEQGGIVPDWNDQWQNYKAGTHGSQMIERSNVDPLRGTKDVLGLLGNVPAVGTFADVASAGLSFGQGKFKEGLGAVAAAADQSGIVGGLQTADLGARYAGIYKEGGKVPEKDEEGGEKSGWFPEGKFLGRDVPKGAGGLMDMLVLGTGGGKVLSKKLSSLPPKKYKSLRARHASNPDFQVKKGQYNWMNRGLLNKEVDSINAKIQKLAVEGNRTFPKSEMRMWRNHLKKQLREVKRELVEVEKITRKDPNNPRGRSLKEWKAVVDKTKKDMGLAGGGMINGPDHENGGVDIEVEGGEYVIPTNIVEKYGKGFFDLLKEGKL